MDDDIEWKSLSIAEKQNYKKMRKEVRLTGCSPKKLF